MLYNRIYHTDAPYPLIKTFFDPREKQTFVSPKKMEEDFFPGHIDPTTKQLISSGLTEYIPADYLDRFSLFLQIIRKNIDSLVKKQNSDMIELYCDIMYVEFKILKNNIILNWVAVRPCAEGRGFYSVLLYWMIHCICRHRGLRLEIKDCLDTNLKILREKQFDIVSIQHELHEDVIQYNAIATYHLCLQLNDTDTWKLSDKIRVDGENITLNPDQYPSAAELNDWDKLQERFFTSPHFKAQLENDYMRNKRYSKATSKRGESIQMDSRMEETYKARFLETQIDKYRRELENKLRKIKSLDSIDMNISSEHSGGSKYSPALSHRKSPTSVFSEDRSPSPIFEDFERTPSEIVQSQRSKRTPTSPPHDLNTKSISESDEDIFNALGNLFGTVTDDHDVSAPAKGSTLDHAVDDPDHILSKDLYNQFTKEFNEEQLLHDFYSKIDFKKLNVPVGEIETWKYENSENLDSYQKAYKKYLIQKKRNFRKTQLSILERDAKTSVLGKRSVSDLTGFFASGRKFDKTIERIESYIQNHGLEPVFELTQKNDEYFVCIKERDKTFTYSPECESILKLFGDKNISIKHFEKMIQIKELLKDFSLRREDGKVNTSSAYEYYKYPIDETEYIERFNNAQFSWGEFFTTAEKILMNCDIDFMRYIYQYAKKQHDKNSKHGKEKSALRLDESKNDFDTIPEKYDLKFYRTYPFNPPLDERFVEKGRVMRNSFWTPEEIRKIPREHQLKIYSWAHNKWTRSKKNDKE